MPAALTLPSPDAIGQWTIENCPLWSIKTGKIVVAIDVYYTAQVLPQWKDRITSAPGPSSPNLVNTEGIRLDSQSYDYLIPQVDGRIVVDGAGQMFWHKRVEWLDNVLDDELLWGVAACFEKYMQKHFRG
ncbi:FAD dependent oxidoreductase superfamily protein [Colletotrichum tofieldiae]|nr:FAD dependent oxidoreductase superfamily protein [Colletotrichum tofieldiae]GKT76682.1 FAD dependent oxidoreductase superfamily protein [Colletotrichum tofieldiae]GKT87734.1 FAD dependent oxidoreductase superfamily protein [Colletotrichum tofieldiae]